MTGYLYLTATIASSGTTSDEIDLSDSTLCGIIIPSAITGATMTVTASPTSGGTFSTVYKDGADLSFTIAASKYVVMQPADFAGCKYIKLVSASSEGAERSITVVTRKMS